MFENWYKYHYRNKEKPNFAYETYDFVHRLTFTSKHNQKYIVRVEEYEKQSLYAVKFYLKNHSLAANKYSISTNFGDATAVICTVVQIMVDFVVYRNALASFVFTGATDVSETSDANTKRFRVYKIIMERFFSVKTFNHSFDRDKSLYILSNSKQTPEILAEIGKIIENEFL